MSDTIFILSYFRTEEEALHLAWSEDGLRWNAFHDNRPVLRATVSNRSVRDPFIRRGADGYYHLLSSDSWYSPNILHARSDDLIHWEPWDVWPVMADVAGTENSWAPELFYDAAQQVYLIFWASVTAGKPYQRMWYTETPDFRAFTPPAVLFDPGYSVIDATLIAQDAVYYLIYKDERGRNAPGTDNKAMRVAAGPSPRGPFAPQTGLVTPPLTEGPVVFRAGDRWRMLYDFFMDKQWGASQSRDLLHWQAMEGLTVPRGARHGSVFTITQAEWERLRDAYG